MIPIFEICKVDTCSVRITGLEQEDKQYSSELIEQYGGFRYSDTVTINILIPINSKNEKIDEHILHDINEHSEENIDESILKFNLDGLHKIIHIILPTKASGKRACGEKHWRRWRASVRCGPALPYRRARAG